MDAAPPPDPEPADLFGLAELGEGRFAYEVVDELCRLDGRLYGGTALATSIAAAEAVSGRPAIWMTTQFVASAPLGTAMTMQAEVLAAGGRTHQVRVTGTDPEGTVVYASLGATCFPRPNGLTATFETVPTVAGPADSVPWENPFAGMARAAGYRGPVPDVPSDVGFHRVVEFREPEIVEHPDGRVGRVCLWARRRDGAAMTRPLIAFVADMVPLGVAQGCRTMAIGVSLDNTVRFGAGELTEWVLVDIRPHLVAGGYGHGDALVWNDRGELVAVASQVASMVAVPLPGE